MKIRQAVKEDAGPVVKLLKEFQEESLDEYGLFYDENFAKDFVTRYVEGSLILENEGAIVGIISGVLSHYPLNAEKIYTELIWFVTKRYRKWGIKLLRELEGWARANGIKKIVMGHMANSKAEKLGRFYEKNGYRMFEVHYLKDLT